MTPIERLVAKDEIADNLFRYARGVDRRDWPAVRAVYHEDAYDQHGEYSGSADGFITWVSARHAAIPFSMHFIGNSLVEFQSANVAAVETYFIAFQRRETPGQAVGVEHQVYGRYIDRFEKRGDGIWKVARRVVAYDSTSQLAATSHLRQLVGTFGSRDQSDPVYENLTASV